MKLKSIIVQVPNFLLAGQNFYIDSSGAVPTGFDKIDLTLQCIGIKDLFVWPEVKLNTLEKLNFTVPDTVSGPKSCQFATVPNDAYIESTANTVLLTQISPEEIESFTAANGLTAASKWILITEEEN